MEEEVKYDDFENALTLTEVADALNINRMTAWKYAKSGKIRAFQLFNQWRILEADLNAFINGNVNMKARMAETSDNPVEVGEMPSSRMDSLLQK